MIPDIQTQLKIAIKSIKDNVAPAVDPDNRLAQEQLFLSLATLDIALSHLPDVHQYVRKDIAEHVALANTLTGLCSDASGASLQAAAVSAADDLQNPELGFTQLQARARALRDVIGAEIAEAATTEAAEAVEKAVLLASEAAISRGRAWNKPMGFEPKPDDVEDLAAQLAK